MGITGYTRTLTMRNGGIGSVALVRAGAVEGVVRDAAGVVSSLRLAEGEVPANYRLREDEALYTENVSPDGLVVHELSFALERMEAASAQAITELMEASPGGVVAIVATNNGAALLVGWSERFGVEYPLRFSRAQGSTGLSLDDPNAERIVLTSIDTAKARTYTGLLP